MREREREREREKERERERERERIVQNFFYFLILSFKPVCRWDDSSGQYHYEPELRGDRRFRTPAHAVPYNHPVCHPFLHSDVIPDYRLLIKNGFYFNTKTPKKVTLSVVTISIECWVTLVAFMYVYHINVWDCSSLLGVHVCARNGKAKC